MVYKKIKRPRNERKIFLFLCAGTRARLELFELLAENTEVVTKWNIRVKEILGKDISVTRLHITL